MGDVYQFRNKPIRQYPGVIRARENRASVRQLPDPVGKTVNHMQIGGATTATIIDEPAAEKTFKDVHGVEGEVVASIHYCPGCGKVEAEIESADQ